MRVLLLTQRFHPATAVGAVRWTTLSRALDESGVDVRVICRREAGEGPDPEDRVVLALRRRGEPTAGGAAQAPIEQPSDDGPSSRAGRLRRSISALAVPDTSVVNWCRRRRDVRAAARLVDPDVVVSTSPPHGLHLVGRWLSHKLGVPLVIDFRDPYVGDRRYDWPLRAPWKQLNRWMEQRMVTDADAVMTAGEDHYHDLRSRHGACADRIFHIPNGYHPRRSDGPGPGAAGPRPVLTVVGRAAAPELATVIKGAHRVSSGQPVRLVTVGLPGEHVAELRGLADVIAYPWTADRELAPILADATVLLLVLSERRGSGSGTSTKLYQYIDAGRSILAVNPTASDERLLQRWSHFRAVHRPDIADAQVALASLLGTVSDDEPHDLEGFRQRYAWTSVAGQVRAVLGGVVPDRSADVGR